MARTLLTVKNPVLKNGVHYMTSDFGVTRTYTNTQGVKKTDTHKGVDMIGAGYSTDYVIAFAAGTVEIATFSSSAGYYVRIDHGNNYKTRYMHMKAGTLKVKVGDVVTKGQVLGYMGATGNVTGAHLHFDIAKNSVYIDPKPFLAGTKSMGVTVTASAPVKTAGVAYFPKYTGASVSIVDALKAVGAQTTFTYRKSIAVKNGITGYIGLASQNTKMLTLLKKGTLKKP